MQKSFTTKFSRIWIMWDWKHPGICLRININAWPFRYWLNIEIMILFFEIWIELFKKKAE